MSPAAGSRRWAPAWLQALVAGALSALVLPPADFLPGLLAYGWLLALLLDAPDWQAAWRRSVGFVFAQALAGLHWVAIAFTVDLDRFGALAVPAVLLLALGIALIQGTTISLLALRRWRSPLAAALVFAPLWLLGEALRSWIGQFPWNLVGYAFADWSWLAQAAALGSVWWLGWLALMLGTLPLARRAAGPTAIAWIVAVLVLVVGLAGWGAARLQAPVSWTDTRLRLVQAGFALDHGFAPERLRAWFFEQVRWSLEPAPAPLDAVIWSEGASPYRLESDEAARAVVADMLQSLAAPWLLTGGDTVVRAGDDSVVGITNSLFAVSAGAAVTARYDKVDLVPFGEFMPFRAILGRIGLRKLTAGSIDYVRGPGRQTIELAGLPSFSPLICYEAIFAGRTFEGPRPAWLLNVTIDTWFGNSIGPHQHLAMARLRAIEEGLPLIRVANSGISANVDPWGRIHDRLDLNMVGVRDVRLPAARPPTPFAQHRWRLLWATIGAGLLLAVLEEARCRRRMP